MILTYYTCLGTLDQDVEPKDLTLISIYPFNAQELQYCEFFAGTANAYRSIAASGVPSCAIDITYLEGMTGVGSNPFDILTNSGLALPA